MGEPALGRDLSRRLLGTLSVVSETSREVSEWDPTVGRHRAPGPIKRPWDPLEKPSGTIGARLWTASRPLSNGAWASTRTYPVTAHRRCHCSRPPRVAWHTPPLLPNEKDARGPHKKDRETPDHPLALSRGSRALPATKPRPSDPNSHSWARQTR